MKKAIAYKKSRLRHLLAATLVGTALTMTGTPAFAQLSSGVNPNATQQDPGFQNAQNATANGSVNTNTQNGINGGVSTNNGTSVSPNGTGSVTNSISGGLNTGPGDTTSYPYNNSTSVNENASGSTPSNTGSMTGNASVGSSTGISGAPAAGGNVGVGVSGVAGVGKR